MKRRPRVSSLIASTQRLVTPLHFFGLLSCALIVFLLFALISEEDSRTEEERFVESLGAEHQAHDGFDDAPLLEKLKAIDAALHVAEAERIELASVRGQLMKELAFNDTDDDDEDDGELSSAEEEAIMFSNRALPSNATCKVYPGSDPHCTRTPRALALQYPKIYVYDLPKKFNREMTSKYKRCSTDQYGTEVFFHEALLVSDVRARTPSEATMFFVPIYGECYLWQYEMLKRENRVKSYELTNALYLEVLDIVRNKHPYWNRTLGRDHIFVFPGARGPTIFSDWQVHIKNSVYLTPEGDRKAFYYNTWKDIVIPGMEADPQFFSPESRQSLVDNPPERKFLAFFRGTIFHREGNSYSRGLRPKLAGIFANRTDVIYDKKQKECDRKCYHEEMSQSVFCLNPLGWTPWTLRFYQAVMTRCIPVLIADDIEFPYESELDYSRFALKIREKEVDNIVQLMQDITEEEREIKRRYMDQIWRMFSYQRPPVPGDAFYMTMRELARKHREFKTSSIHEWD